ncbi:Flagellar brake protein YcgR [Caballeronia pedi]|uniref:Flagellar brake protein YcgR n=1 Tax=Caballeronia pedi TaxID=1777141 RepID=A0A158DEA1_9BURK|nr:PilZ domain-containing protein [Caballeronia pedi]SAK92919.1 Flagellar brake protein YcgR [Caballeronia pedi]
MARVRVSCADLSVGVPLQFPIYSVSGDLLLGRGYVIQKQDQIDRLIEMKAFRHEMRGEYRGIQNGPVFGILNTNARTQSRESRSQGPVVTTFPAFTRGPEFFLLSVRRQEDVSFSVNFVGTLKGQSLLVTVPQCADAFQPGAEVKGKIVVGRYIYMFHSRVQARVLEPFDILHIDLPVQATRQIFRRHLRVDVDLNARVIRNDMTTAGFDATIVNLSIGGMGISVPEADLMVGEHFRISLRLPAGDGFGPSLMLTGIVRNASVRSAQHRVFGVELQGLSDQERASLQNYIFDIATSLNPAPN